MHLLVQLAPALADDLGEAWQVVRAHGGCFWCALRPSGAVECMDKTDGSTSTKLHRASVIEAGNEHACAITYDSEVQCWGKNVRGELGRDTSEPALMLGNARSPSERPPDCSRPQRAAEGADRARAIVSMICS